MFGYFLVEGGSGFNTLAQPLITSNQKLHCTYEKVWRFFFGLWKIFKTATVQFFLKYVIFGAVSAAFIGLQSPGL